MLLSYAKFVTPTRKLKSHQACPECRKRGKDTKGDNLYVWEDGHAFCFSCQYTEINGKAIGEKIEKLAKAQNEEIVKEKTTYGLPPDSDKTIDVKALKWLDSYGITREEIIEHDLWWSVKYNWLIFPFRDGDGNIIAFQARVFNSTIKGHKWYSQGKLDELLHILGSTKHPNSAIIVVEDIISAIKVARYARSLPLFGSFFGLQKLNRLRMFTKSLVVWLDADKYSEAIRKSQLASRLGYVATAAFTEEDPKSCSDEDIKNIIALGK